MATFTIITNNPMVIERLQNTMGKDIIWVNASAQDVLLRVRGEVQKGAVLLSHPLAGSLQPGLNPYKSVLVSKPLQQVDFQSVKHIDESINTYKKNIKLKHLSYHEKALNDFQIHDLELMASVLSRLPQEYNGLH